jgi:hypothetical protein
MVFLKLRGSLGSSKGYAPTSMTYSVTPVDQTSAISPSYCFRESTSGAIYAGVPTVDFGCESKTADCRHAAQPKCQTGEHAKRVHKPPTGPLLSYVKLVAMNAAGCPENGWRRPSMNRTLE